MKNFYKLFLLLLSAGVISACSKENNEPDNLADKIIDPVLKEILIRKFDTNVDFQLSNEEINKVEELWLEDNYKIRSFEGIEVFTHLKEIRLGKIATKTIDLSKNLNLQYIYTIESPKLEIIYLPISLKGIIDTHIEDPTIAIYK